MTPILQFILAVAVILLCAKAGAWLSVRLGQPAVLGELLSGLLLGPSVLDFLHLPFFTDAHLGESIGHLAELGVILLMFIAGLEVELSEMRRAGRVASASGVAGVALPLVLGLGTALAFGYPFQKSLFMGIILTATSVSISAQTLLELNALRSRLGVALLGAAVVDDVLVILVLSLFLALAAGGGGALDVVVVVLRMVLYLGGAIVLGAWLFPRIARRIEYLRVSEAVMVVGLIVTLLYAWAAEALGGVALITGAFIAGVLFGRTPMRHKLDTGMHTLAYAFFVPIFFVSIGLEANVRLLTGDLFAFTLVFLVMAIIGKIVGSGLAARWTGFSNAEALQMGIGMVSRGEVGLIVATIGVNEGIISEQVFTVTVIMVLVTTLITPLALRWALARGATTPARPVPVAAQDVE
ncbi:MAG: cation:proton antiporter [Anaerolineae bacterium]|nr:cation:proton antiporter [Anaerolineae bacterium]